jgi:hypothetical protein
LACNRVSFIWPSTRSHVRHFSEIPTIRPLGFNLQNMAFLKRAVERML